MMLPLSEPGFIIFKLMKHVARAGGEVGGNRSREGRSSRGYREPVISVMWTLGFGCISNKISSQCR